MPGWLKALLIVFVVVIVLAVGVVAIAGFWIYRNKDTIVAKTKQIATEAKEYGEKTDNQGCVDESISRYKASPGFTATISNGIFMRICLDNSRPTPGFCDEVPKQMEFMKTAQWRKEQCRRFDLNRDSNCTNLFAPIQQFCEEGRRSQ
jgi:hypothetical protein